MCEVRKRSANYIQRYLSFYEYNLLFVSRWRQEMPNLHVLKTWISQKRNKVSRNWKGHLASSGNAVLLQLKLDERVFHHCSGTLKIFINYTLHVLFFILYIRLHENIPLPPYCKMIFLDFFVIFHDEIKYINTNEAKRLIINITLVIKKNNIKY